MGDVISFYSPGGSSGEWKASDANVADYKGDAGYLPLIDGGGLYESGLPRPHDVQQNGIGDCYFLATIAALARHQPDLIEKAIEYDETTQSFNVTFLDSNGRPMPPINVSQAELWDNIARGGGSTLDDLNPRDAAWPAVLETAFAKMHDSNPADGLDEGYAAVGNGGKVKNAMGLFIPAPRLESFYADTDEGAALLNNFHYGDTIVVASRDDEDGGIPGFVKKHAFSVVDVEANPDDPNDPFITLQNPWNGEDRPPRSPSSTGVWAPGEWTPGEGGDAKDLPSDIYGDSADVNINVVDIYGSDASDLPVTMEDFSFVEQPTYPPIIRVKLSQLEGAGAVVTTASATHPVDVGVVIATD